jgi:membrane protein implicated in regulation of membrane protease activity
MTLKKRLRFDWEAIAGIIAAMVAIAMYFVHIIVQEVLITITVVLLALLFTRNLRRERGVEEM